MLRGAIPFGGTATLLSVQLVLIASFAGMPDRQQDDLVAVKVVQDDISSVPERDDPFTEAGWHVFDGATKLRLLRQNAHAAPNRLDSAPRCIEV